MKQAKSVLILGGSGQAGSGTAALLRRWHPDLPLTIAGRDLGRAQAVADDLGAATAVTVDIRRVDLGLPADADYSAVVATLWDSHQNGLRYAQQRGLPYLSVSSGLLEIAPEVVAAAQRPSASPVLMASHFCAGSIALAIQHLIREFEQVDSIRVGAILDEQDTGGPAGNADLERWAVAGSAGLVRRAGVFTWVPESDVQAEVLGSDDVPVAGATVGILDVPSIALATGAPNIDFVFAVGESAGRRRGGSPSMEVRIDLQGTGPAGKPLSTSQYLVHPDGQVPVTAAGIAMGVERLLGLRGEAVPPGLHTPESLIDPAYAVQRMLELGVTFVDAREVDRQRVLS